MVTFRNDVPISRTMIFEKQYENQLQLSLYAKRRLFREAKTYGVWMYVDGVLAGETYGAVPYYVDKEIDDVDMFGYQDNPRCVYIYSTTILPQFCCKGYGKLLKAYSLGYLKAMGMETVLGHSTTKEMKHINELFGAKHLVHHINWADTQREAWFYVLKLI